MTWRGAAGGGEEVEDEWVSAVGQGWRVGAAEHFLEFDGQDGAGFGGVVDPAAGTGGNVQVFRGQPVEFLKFVPPDEVFEGFGQGDTGEVRHGACACGVGCEPFGQGFEEGCVGHVRSGRLVQGVQEAYAVAQGSALVVPGQARDVLQACQQGAGEGVAVGGEGFFVQAQAVEHEFSLADDAVAGWVEANFVFEAHAFGEVCLQVLA